MKMLQELVAVINRNKTKSISIIGNGKGDNTKVNQLYQLIAGKKVSSDEEAFALLYPGEGDKNSYYKLKHQLKDRLYNTAFFIDAKRVKYGSRMSAYVECQWLVCLASIFHAMRARENMLELCKKAKKIAKKYEFTSVLVSVYSMMLNHSKMTGKIKMLAEQSHELLELSALYQKELHASIYLTKIGGQYVKNRAVKKQVAKEAEEYLMKLESLPSSRDSKVLMYNITMLNAAKFLALNDYKNAIPILSVGLDKLLSAQVIENTYVYGVAINLLACQIALKQYRQGEQLIEQLYEYTVPASYNWYKTREMHFILEMHTQRYPQAEHIYQSAITQKTFKKLPQHLREIWTIYGAYLEIARQAGKLPAPPAGQKPFRITRYLNNLPVFSRDKRGQNVPVVISHIVLMLQQDKHDQLIDRFEAVGKYRSRYVNRDDNFRANMFLRMLDQVVKNDFNRKKTVKGSVGFRQQLSTMKTDVLDQNYDQEILPYEDLWDIMVPLLDD